MINIEWLKDNFSNNFIIFDIGCAGMNSEIKIFRDSIPDSKIYAFDCENYWLNQNLENSVRYGVYYFHIAMHSEDTVKKFTPSVSENGDVHPYSGSFYKDVAHSSKKIYGEPYDVMTVRLDTFCKTFNVEPDFIHMDVEGSEFEVMSSIGNIRPKAIWTEVIGFNSYACPKQFAEFDDLMKNLGYTLKFNDGCDALYCLNGFNHTDYNPIGTK